MPLSYKSSYKENIADAILKWVEKSEETGTLTIKGTLNIAVIATTISKLN